MEKSKYIEKFKVDYEFRLAPSTISDYQQTVRQMQDNMEKSFDIITKKDIRNWLITLEENGYKRNSINKKLIGLKTFYQYCIEEGVLTKNPVKEIPIPKIMETMPRYLTKKQISSLLALVEGRLYERTIIEVLYATGVRISELIKMKKEDINWSERSILISEGKGKKSRIVLFNLGCAQYLYEYLNSRTDQLPYVFINQQGTNKIYVQKITALFRSYSKHLGFRVTPHMLRHTFAAHLAERGMPLESIQQLLGHETTHSTQLYAKLYNQARKEIYDNWM
ncbi:tyrosine-type recombinase/integrase [Lysinibacillus sp. NPDC093688]|uniref:tyrosine-type recombinase/integrase n=1 Tax=Lysinibacillus sp. NPDC093688 TaxID=3390577 RepID=UPI003D027BEA